MTTVSNVLGPISEGDQAPLRVLFSTNGLDGHFQPLVPFARGLQELGHSVAFATSPYFVPAIEAAGFRGLPVGSQPPPAEGLHVIFQAIGHLNHAEKISYMRQWYFLGEQKRQEIRDILAVIEDWKPDLLVREETEFGACVAAERAGLPHASVQVTVSGQIAELRTVSPPRLAALRAEVGLPPDDELASFEPYLVLSPFPPGLRKSGAFVPPTLQVIQPAPSNPTGSEQTPAWLQATEGRPLIYASLGTVFNNRTDVFERILKGLRDEPVELILTVGRNGDPTQFGPQPPNIHIERFVPQSLLYPHCAVAVIHGGSGTMIGALQHGVPLVVMPFGADHPGNVLAAQAAGVARALDPEQMTAEEVREAVSEILARTEYRDNARRIQAEIAGLPPFAHGLRLLEQLARKQAPLGTAA